MFAALGTTLTTISTHLKKSSELSRNLLNRGLGIFVVVNLSSLFIFPLPTLPLVPVASFGGAKVGRICNSLVAVLRSEVFDLRRFSIDLGVQVRHVLTSRPERHNGMFGVFDGLGVQSRKLVQALREMIDSTGSTLVR